MRATISMNTNKDISITVSPEDCLETDVYNALMDSISGRGSLLEAITTSTGIIVRRKADAQL